MSDEVHNSAAARVFFAWGEGAEISILRSHDSGGITTLTCFRAGATGRIHGHPGGEELYVVSGCVRVGEFQLAEGDYLYTPPGGVHDVEAIDDTVLFLVLPQAPDYNLT